MLPATIAGQRDIASRGASLAGEKAPVIAVNSAQPPSVGQSTLSATASQVAIASYLRPEKFVIPPSQAPTLVHDLHLPPAVGRMGESRTGSFPRHRLKLQSWAEALVEREVLHYPIEIFRDATHWTATVPGLPVTAIDSSRERVERRIGEALRFHLQACVDEGQRIPLARRAATAGDVVKIYLR